MLPSNLLKMIWIEPHYKKQVRKYDFPLSLLVSFIDDWWGIIPGIQDTKFGM